MLTIIPLLSGQENDREFLEKAIEGAGEIVFVIVVDTESREEFGFTASHIQKARQALEDAKKILEEKGKSAEDIVEWGNTQSKILNIALLRKAQRVVLKKQDNHYFEQLVKALKKEKFKTEVISTEAWDVKKTGKK